MRSDNIVLFAVGAVGLLLGLIGLVARPDPVGIALGVLVLIIGGISLYLGWTFWRGSLEQRQQ
jgi:hypothetical protein